MRDIKESAKAFAKVVTEADRINAVDKLHRIEAIAKDWAETMNRVDDPNTQLIMSRNMMTAVAEICGLRKIWC